MYLEKAKALFRDREEVPSEGVSGFSEDELRELERQLGRTLPASYKESLLWMGHGAGRFMEGTLFLSPWIPAFTAPGAAADPWSLTNGARNLLSENSFVDPLPDDAFVFSMHEGYQFWFFRFCEGDDPPVYGFGEGETKDHFELIDGSFSGFMLRLVADDIHGKE